MTQEEYKADVSREEWLEARRQKQELCIMHKKRCAECDGKDEYGDNCKYFRRKEVI